MFTIVDDEQEENVSIHISCHNMQEIHNQLKDLIKIFHWPPIYLPIDYDYPQDLDADLLEKQRTNEEIAKITKEREEKEEQEEQNKLEPEEAKELDLAYEKSQPQSLKVLENEQKEPQDLQQKLLLEKKEEILKQKKTTVQEKKILEEQSTEYKNSLGKQKESQSSPEKKSTLSEINNKKIEEKKESIKETEKEEAEAVQKEIGVIDTIIPLNNPMGTRDPKDLGKKSNGKILYIAVPFICLFGLLGFLYKKKKGQIKDEKKVEDATDFEDTINSHYVM